MAGDLYESNISNISYNVVLFRASNIFIFCFHLTGLYISVLTLQFSDILKKYLGILHSFYYWNILTSTLICQHYSKLIDLNYIS